VIFTVNELILMPFIEHYITLPLIENIKLLMLLVKSSIFRDNIQYTKPTPDPAATLI
jgi:hypothetical protein